MSSALPMIATCFRHQHPEAFDRPEVLEPWVPQLVRYGASEDIQASTTVLHEEEMGNPEARRG